MLSLILLVVAFLCFLCAAFGVSSKMNLVAVGLASWVLANLLPAIP